MSHTFSQAWGVDPPEGGHRVALTSRKTHAATAESNDRVYSFFVWALQAKPPGTPK